ncbi:SDR family oxidoreductase [Photobacterium gaetbulicola]|uniref:3-oxoacyl-(Acyl-carrier-protein) reductase n=1 Tax=Photobacterium gaetbulicola Gung47 TaxID=658445 RepID=A0A0C5WN88_9GAMM|nr:3-oxoacyl-ACP reductase FabG [Photobacterium gaetbulicola]AJR06549.1 3-oxoacyl-(acyl-carrier-protein) reductase [Photobacterium gaetbulicola Gung47]PSU03533.1 SDR family oxidoreductase [Photobacterium gaetbulicola]
MERNESTSRPVALVTGATRGIGRSIALAFAQKGYDLAFCYRSNQAEAVTLMADIERAGARVLSHQLDVSDEAAVTTFFGRLEQQYGRLDVLVNNAGQTRDGLLVSMEKTDMEAVLATNVVGTMLFCREAVKLMLPARSGSIVNLSSVSAVRANKGQTNYAASKGAVEALTRALAVEVGKKGIRVNAVAPGVIKTEMTGELLDNFEKQLKQRLLARKFGEPSDIAEAVLFLARPENHYITGQVLTVDGGLVLG